MLSSLKRPKNLLLAPKDGLIFVSLFWNSNLFDPPILYLYHRLAHTRNQTFAGKWLSADFFRGSLNKWCCRFLSCNYASRRGSSRLNPPPKKILNFDNYLGQNPPYEITSTSWFEPPFMSLFRQRDEPAYNSSHKLKSFINFQCFR